MRFVYKLLLGLILFNSLIVIFAFYFNYDAYTANANTTGYTAYGTNNIGSYLIGVFTNPQALGVFVLLMAVSGFGGLFSGIHTKAFLGFSILFSFTMTILTGSFAVFTPLTNYPVVRDIYALIMVGIGVVILLSITDAFMDRNDMG